MKVRLSMLVLLVFLAVQAVVAQQAPGAEFDEYVNKAIKEWGVPGVAIAIVKDDRIVFAKGKGFVNFRLNTQGKVEVVNIENLSEFTRVPEPAKALTSVKE